jgi:hypothetical protein
VPRSEGSPDPDRRPISRTTTWGDGGDTRAEPS